VDRPWKLAHPTNHKPGFRDHCMKTYLSLLLVVIAWSCRTQAAEGKAILDVAPSLTELGESWTTNLIAYLLDPRSQPSEVDYLRGPKSSPVLDYHRQQMKSDGRTGYGTILYGHGGMVMNKGLYRVYIQRWSNTPSLDKRWVDWKSRLTRVVRSAQSVGEAFFWAEDGMFQKLTFRRGLFHVVVEAGSASDFTWMVRLAEVIDAKIQGQPIPKVSTKPGTGEKDEQDARPKN
jgi:hypothetical protein